MQASNKAKDAIEYEHVFQQYLEICNHAIEQNKTKFPYTEIWGARLKDLKEEVKIHAVVFDETMQKTLEACGGNITRASETLGMAKSTFYRKVKNVPTPKMP